MKKLFFVAISAFMMMSCQKEKLLLNEPISTERAIYDHFKINKIENVENFNLTSIKGFEKFKNGKASNTDFESVEAIYYEDGNITYLINDGTEEKLILHTSSDNELIISKVLIYDESDFADNNYSFSVTDDEGQLVTFNVVDGEIVNEGNARAGTFRQCMSRRFVTMTSDLVGQIAFATHVGPILALMAISCI